VLFDAVAVLPSVAGAAIIAKDAASKDFVSDAFGHCKFIGYSKAATTLFEESRVKLDAGFLPLASAKDAQAFVKKCRELRFWPREMAVDLDAAASIAKA